MKPKLRSAVPFACLYMAAVTLASAEVLFPERDRHYSGRESHKVAFQREQHAG